MVSDSLEKVYPDRTPRPIDRSIRLAAFPGEKASIQLAYRPTAHAVPLAAEARIEVSCQDATVSVATVGLVPVEVPAFPAIDAGYDDTRPGLYPDLLLPAPQGRLRPVLGQWRSAWIDVSAATAGTRRLDLRVLADGIEVYRDRLEVDVLDIEAPPLGIVNTHWLHVDALADYYRVEVFSEEHWQIIDGFLEKAAEMGVNSVLTPVWTPPVDTEIGSYRTPVQLVAIQRQATGYRFDFTRLHRWIDSCLGAGITRLEMPHLFTQWGAGWCPAIYVDTPRGQERVFGWDTPATDPAYRELLEALLPKLLTVLQDRVGRDKVVFHVSDEPDSDALDAYSAARAQVRDLLAGWKVIDAVSDPEFLRRGAVEVPVVATDAVAAFHDPSPPELWVYYCLAQHVGVANRFIAMPSARSRALGHQLYAAAAAGFLHWGFNFYYELFARHLVDPFQDTCAGGRIPGGDAFVVYPGAGGEPLESIRFKVLSQIAWDLRAFQTLARLRGRQAVLALVDPDATLGFDSFSPDPGHYLRTRAAVNAELMR